MNSTDLLAPLFLLMLAILSGWLLYRVDSDSMDGVITRNTPDYYLEGVTARTINAQGQLQHQLSSRDITHYPADDRTEVGAPRFAQLQNQGSHWRIRADHGELDADYQTLQLEGAVEMRRERNAAPAMLITTERLWTDSESGEVRSAERVNLTSGQSHFTAIGLEGNWKTRQLSLLSEVRGTYVQP